MIHLHPAHKISPKGLEKIKNAVDDFIDGQEDCKKGQEHKPGRSAAYDAGYGYQYELEQIAGELWK